MNNGGQFRNWTWDPCLLTSQILAMLGIYYSCLAFWLTVVDTLSRSSLSLEPIFSYQSLYIHDFGGRRIFLTFLCNTLSSAFGLWFVVQRAKLCLDFTTTVHFWHLIFTWIYNRTFPASVAWWILQATCVTITTVLGEYLCMRTELRTIPVSLGAKAEV